MRCMATTSLQHAIEYLDQLPAPVQDNVAEQLIAYVKQWLALQDGIDQGADELARGEGIEITNVDAFVDTLTKEHERS